MTLDLHGTTNPWTGVSGVFRVTRTHRHPAAPTHIYIGASPQAGFAHSLLTEEGATSSPRLPSGLAHLDEGDVIRVTPGRGEIHVLYRRASPHNAVLLTEQCNSRCLMCSQPPRDLDDSATIRMWLDAVPLMDPRTKELGISGGEPTLLAGELLELLHACRRHLPTTSLHLLSNGRRFEDVRLAKAVAEAACADLMVGVPLYAAVPELHDYVVQAIGAFDETIRGIINLKRCGVRVELRVVLHAQTVPGLEALARFTARNLPFVDHVALMGLELEGFAKANLALLWTDPLDYQAQLLRAASELQNSGMRVSIYNHQLCTLPRKLWPLARRSISDWKNEYVSACEDCLAREACGGFFASSRLRHSRGISPIREPLE